MEVWWKSYWRGLSPHKDGRPWSFAQQSFSIVECIAMSSALLLLLVLLLLRYYCISCDPSGTHPTIKSLKNSWCWAFRRTDQSINVLTWRRTPGHEQHATSSTFMHSSTTCICAYSSPQSLWSVGCTGFASIHPDPEGDTAAACNGKTTVVRYKRKSALLVQSASNLFLAQQHLLLIYSMLYA